MQMQPITPLGPLVVGAKEPHKGSKGENSMDSLLTSIIGSVSAANNPTGTPATNGVQLAAQPPPGETETPIGEVDTSLLEQIEATISSPNPEEIQLLATVYDLTAAVTTENHLSENSTQLLPGSDGQPILFSLVKMAGQVDQQTEPQDVTTIPVPNLKASPPTDKPDVPAAEALPADLFGKTLTSAPASLPEQTAPLRKQEETNLEIKAESRLLSPIGQIDTLQGPMPKNLHRLGPAHSLTNTIDLRFMELAPGGDSSQQTMKTAPARAGGLPFSGTLIDVNFAQLLGISAGPACEALPELVSLRQRNAWAAVTEASSSFAAIPQSGQEAAVTGILAQFATENGHDGLGKNMFWFKPHHADTVQNFSFTGGGENMADFLDSISVTPETKPTTTLRLENTGMQLPLGLSVSGNQIVDHVVRQVTLHAQHESNTISIRMHPEELGRLKMELMSDEHGIKAHIQVQSQQVQDILEKHLYRLKEGFVQQGLNLNEIQVSVNSGKNSGLNLFSEQQPHAQPQTSNTAATKEAPESIADEIMARPHVHEGLISLHI